VLYIEAVMTSGSGGLQRLLTARVAGDHVGNSDKPRSQNKKSEQAHQYTVNIMSDLQYFNLICVILVILTPIP